MATAIEWADESWNPIRALDRATGRRGWHCERVSEGCRHCYAEGMNAWRGTRRPYKPGEIDGGGIELRLDTHALGQPHRWRTPRTIFVCSMTDLFGRFVPDDWIWHIFNVMAGADRHRFIVLTKRPARMRAMLERIKPDGDGFVTVDGIKAMRNRCSFVSNPRKWPLRNVILGTSAEDQATADERIPELLETPAATRIVSAEPLLGPLDLHNVGTDAARGVQRWDALLGRRYDAAGNPADCAKLDGVIVGGESGHGARPMHPAWPRALRDQVKGAGAAYFFKQWGEWREWAHGEPDIQIDNDEEMADAVYASAINPGFVTIEGRFFPKRHELPLDTPCRLMERLGKQAAGRELDGRTWDELP